MGGILANKRITLLRHAKSAWDDPVARDFDRGLNDRGERAAKRVGEAAREQALAIDSIVASPAVRVIETLDLFLPAAGLDAVEPHWDRRVYLASSATLLDVLREQDDAVDHVLMCGHNPGMEDLVLDLVPDSESSMPALRDAVEEKFPTAALATIDCAVESWQQLKAGCGQLLSFVRPRDLDPSLGPDS